jgi:hypothetical protein
MCEVVRLPKSGEPITRSRFTVEKFLAADWVGVGRLFNLFQGFFVGVAIRHA